MKILALPVDSSSNPYVGQLYASMRSYGVKAEKLSLVNALLSRADFVHIHWPDGVFNGVGVLAFLRRVVPLCVNLLFAKLRGAKLIWTVHNLNPHEVSYPQWLINAFYWCWLKQVNGYLFLSDSSRKAFEVRFGECSEYSVIPHGHYRDFYSNVAPTSYLRDECRISSGDFVFGHYGLIREYKNVPSLMCEFSKLKGAQFKLVVAGKIGGVSDSLRREIETIAAKDDRIYFREGFLSEAEIAELFSFTDLAVLPYKRILNSGSALLALSFNCPILVPNLDVMRELQSLSGGGVYYITSKELSQDLEYVANQVNEVGQHSLELSALDWAELGKMTSSYFKSVRGKPNLN